jgi:hypothetical protein
MSLAEVLATALIATSVLDLTLVLIAVRQRSAIVSLRDTVTAYSIISNKRGHTIDEQAQMLVELSDRNERLNEDLRRLRNRLPGLEAAFAETQFRFWTCPVEGHTNVEWRGDVAHCMTPECGRTSADVVDEDVARAYIPEYGAGDGR